mgnify:CR=1 FL=1
MCYLGTTCIYYVLYLPGLGGGTPQLPSLLFFTVILLILLIIILILIIIIVTGIAHRFDAVIIVELILLTSPLFSLLHRGHIAAPLLRLHLYDAQVSNGV